MNALTIVYLLLVALTLIGQKDKKIQGLTILGFTVAYSAIVFAALLQELPQ